MTQPNPFKGLSPFTADDENRFWGRDDEKDSLFAYVSSTNQLVVYGKSGVGKSSLLQAGLVPRLRQNNFFPVYAKIDNDPIDAIQRYVIEALGDTGQRHLSKTESLPNFFDQTRLVLKQTIGHAADETPLALIVDQFEDFFGTFQPNGVEETRRKFIEQVAETIYRKDLPLIFVWSIREDFLPEMAVFRPKIPSILNSHYRLAPLLRKNAKEAIVNPLKNTGVQFEEILVNRILQDLQEIGGGAVEPFALQMVCSHIWDRWKSRDNLITLDFYANELKGLQNILGEFVEDKIKEFSLENRRIIKKIFPELFTVRGRGRLVHVTSLYDGVKDQVESEDKLRENILQPLDKKYHFITLRSIKDVSYCEPIHDTLSHKATEWREQLQREALEKKLRAEEHLRQAAEAERQAAEAERHRRELEQARALAEERQGRAEAERKSAKTRGLLVLALATLLIIVTGVAGKLNELRKQAADAENTAKGSLLTEEKAKQSEIEAREQAENAARRAEALATREKQAREATIKIQKEAEKERNVATSLRLTLAARDIIPQNRELGVLLALHAVSASRTTEAEAVLREAVQVSSVELTPRVGHREAIVSVAFSSDGKRLATASEDRTAKLWSVETGSQFGTELLTLRGHSGGVRAVAFSPDGKLVATGSFDDTARLWDSASGKEILSLSGHRDTVSSVAFSPDGKRLATASEDRTAKLRDVATGKELGTFSGHIAAVRGVAFSPDGKRLATASDDRTAKLWDVETRNELLTLSGHGGVVRSVAFSFDGKRLATASEDRTAKLWDVESGKELLTLRGHTGPVRAAAFSADGKLVATGSFDDTARLWEGLSGKELRSLSGHGVTVSTTAFSLDGKRLATGGEDRTAKVWELESGKEVRTFSGHTGAVRGVAFSPDGKRLATASADRTAKLWELESGKEVRSLSGHTAAVRGVAFSPDGKRLATASEDRTAKLWELETGKELRTLSGHTGAVNNLAFSPDGKRLATASEDRTAKLWELETGKELRTLSGHTGAVNSVIISSSGKEIATASQDGTGKLWETETGKELQTLRGHIGPVRGVNFSPDGRLLTVGADRTLRSHVLFIEDLMTLARARVKRSLTLAECQKYNVSGKQCEAVKRVEEGRQLIGQGKIREAVAAYANAERFDSSLVIPAPSWNTLCWFGSLWGRASDVLNACEKAVSLDPSNGGFRDSRGLARALTGKTEAAIEDFQAYLKETPFADRKGQRQRWIDALRAGQNPFTPEEIKSLFGQ